MTNEQIRQILAQLHEALDSTVPTKHYEASWNAVKECRNMIEKLTLSLEFYNMKRDEELIKDARTYSSIISGNLGDFDNYKFVYIQDHKPQELLKRPKPKVARRSRKKHHE